MESTTSVMCSICCEMFRKFEKTSRSAGFLKQLTFLIRTSTDAFQNIFICETCLTKVQDAYDFKRTCMENFREVTTNVQVDPGIFCLCRICRKIIKNTSSVLWPHFVKEFKEIGNLIKGSNLEMYKDSHICVTCQESALNFVSVTKLLSNYDEKTTHKDNVNDELPSDSSFNSECRIEEVFVEDSNENSTENNLIIDDGNVSVKDEIDSESEDCQYEDFIQKHAEFYKKMDCEQSDYLKKMWTNSEQSNSINSLNLSLHFQINCNDSKLFSCEICDYKTKVKGSLKRHMLIHKSLDEIETFTCALCDFKTKEKDVFKQHMFNIHEAYECDCCEHPAKNGNNFKEHTVICKNIDGVEMFPCYICGFKAKKKGNLMKHMLVHKSIDEIELFKCDICDFKTRHKHIIKSHILVHKNIEELEVFKCDLCEYKTRIKGNFKRHIITHKSINETEIFTCEICNYKTKTKGHLKQHLLIHKNFDEVETFTCTICNFKAKRKGNLKKHMISHKNADEIEMFKCDVCEFKTKYKHILKSHMLVHKNIDDIEVFKCNICGYKGKRKDTLKRHMLTHKNIPEIKIELDEVVQDTPIWEDGAENIKVTP